MGNLIKGRKLVKDLAFDLDSEFGSIGGAISTLVDAEVLLGQLVDSMDSAVYRGEERLYYRQHHRMIRVLSELIRYTLDDLNKEYEKAYEISHALLQLAKEKKEDKVMNFESLTE